MRGINVNTHSSNAHFFVVNLLEKKKTVLAPILFFFCKLGIFHT